MLIFCKLKVILKSSLGKKEINEYMVLQVSVKSTCLKSFKESFKDEN